MVDRTTPEAPIRVAALEHLAVTNKALDGLRPNPFQRAAAAAESVRCLDEALVLRDAEAGRATPGPRAGLADALRLRSLLLRDPTIGAARRDEGDDPIEEAEAATARALALLEEARALDPPEEMWAHLSTIEGLCWKDRRVSHPEALDHEVKAFEYAVAHLDGSIEDPAIARRNLANALAERNRRGGAGADLDAAFAHHRASAEQLHDPVGIALTVLNWVGQAHQARRWDEVIAAGEEGLRRLGDAAAGQQRFADATRLGGPMSVVGRHLADAHRHTGDLIGAAAAIDRCRGVAAAALRGGRGGDDSWRRDRHEVEERIRAAADHRTLCYLIHLDDEVVTVVIGPGGRAETVSAPLDRVEAGQALAGYYSALGAYVEAIERRQVDAAVLDRVDAEIDRLGRWLGRVPLAGMLDCVDDRAPLAIVPTGHLNAAPLQLARLPVSDRWLTDRQPITLVYNGSRLADAPSPVDRGTSLLLVGDPESDKLAAAAAELDAVRDAWPGPVVGPIGSVDEVRPHLPAAGVLHVASHALFDPEYPMASGIGFVDGALTISDLVEADMQASLDYLAACSTGMASALSADESISIGNAFTVAGARDVVATSWPVPDQVAAAVSVAFYEGLCERRLGVAAALAEAVTHVRDGAPPSGDLTERFAERIAVPHPLRPTHSSGFLHASG